MKKTIKDAGFLMRKHVKLAELRDEGILTEEEFAAKKKQLLGI